MSGKKAAKHELINVNSHPEGSMSGVCSCGRWGYAGAASARKLRSMHAEHIREVGGGR